MDDGDRLLSELKPSDITRGQLFAMTFAFMLKHCLTQAATSDLMALLNVVLAGCLPPNLYHFNKITDVGDALLTYLYCPNCEALLGKHDRSFKLSNCPVCDNHILAPDLLKSGNFFNVPVGKFPAGNVGTSWCWEISH